MVRRRHQVRSRTTESTEEYLEALSRLAEKGEKLSTKNIADRLGVSQASVSEMLGKLESEGYIDHRPYRGISLTQRGRRLGGRVLGRHRLIERFLSGMGMNGRRIHDEACRLEHHVSDELAKLISEKVEQKEQRKGLISISEMRNGESGEIASIEACSRSVKRLEDMGLTPGAKVSINRAAPFSGPVEICIRDSCLVIGNGMASKIFVKVGK